MSLRRFFMSCFDVLRERSLLFALMNFIFFGSVIAGSFLAQQVFLTPMSLPFDGGNLEISNVSAGFVFEFFGWNLVVNAFLFMTVPGVFFFALPFVVFILRGLIWGFTLTFLSTDKLLAILPTVFLEGEGYVLAAMAGVILGLSWFWPRLIYPSRELSRREALSAAWGEAKILLAIVVLLLLIAAIVKTVTLALLFG